jgi:hypothetical protein
VRREVYARMISERNRIAEQFRAEGAGEAARINGERERELKKISSEAYREAEGIKGRADAEAADIYARVYNLDPEFYRFRKSMEVLNATMGKDTVVLLATDGELLRYQRWARTPSYSSPPMASSCATSRSRSERGLDCSPVGSSWCQAQRRNHGSTDQLGWRTPSRGVAP